MSVTIRQVKWMTSSLRPVAMPSIKCPYVKDWSSGQRIAAVLAIGHCLPCAYACKIKLDMKAQTGEVHCAAS